MSSAPRNPPPPIPPSPTLSNPDMILPVDDNERENSTPSPPFNLPSLSHLQSFYEGRTTANHYGVGNGYNRLDPNSGRNINGAARGTKKAFPRHTWMHEGHDAASRRLSDIGEEDAYANANANATTPSSRHGSARNSRVLMNLPAQQQGGPTRVVSGSAAIPSRGMENPEMAELRADSGSSTGSSTVSGASETSSWDGAKGQGEQRVERRADGRPNGGSGAQASVTANVPVTGEEGPDEDFSAAILESEAERILENAKKRLSLMEGNLTRARSSMRANTPSAPSPAPSGSPQTAGLGQPVGGLYQSIHRAADRRSSLRPRSTYTRQDASNRHSRVHSETNLPSQPSMETNLSRSMSAMGSSTSSSFHTDERSFQYAPTRAYLTHRASVSSTTQHPAISVQSGNERASSASPRGSDMSEKDQKISNMEEFNNVYPVADPPSRSQSQLQVRDLQDQMKGLHIKISTLKVKAQEDNLKRRSLQSLRTPSPLTDANHWYGHPLDPTASSSHLQPSPGFGYIESPGNSGSSGRSSSSKTDSTLLVPETINSGRPSSDGAILPPFELTDHAGGSRSESLYEDAAEGEFSSRAAKTESEIDREELEEILREPLDEEDDLDDQALESFPDVPHPTDDTPHEEREDAFDYEHFILHSALGNYTARMRRQTDASDTSVETTRPLHKRRSMKLSRSNSTTSLSTVATFATAAEGRDDIESVLYWDRKFNDELKHRYVEEDERSSPQRPSPETPRTPRASRVEVLTSQRPDCAATGSATPTSLASSLVSTVRAAASPYPTNGNLGINEDDTRLLEQLFKSLGDVCLELQELTTSPDYDEKQAKLLRRRLEGARRVLDGELD